MTLKPLIGCTTYSKRTDDLTPLDVYGLMPSYVQAIQRAGGLPILIPLSLSETDLFAIMQRIDGLLIPGGGDIDPARYQGAELDQVWGIDRERDRVEITLTQEAVRLKKPLLTICRGVQILNVALGGTLWEDVPSQLPSEIAHDNFVGYERNYLAHTISITSNSLLAQQLETTNTWVNSFHHQALRNIASDLSVTATSPDGLVEAVEINDYPSYALGVQWHPENLIDDDPAMLCLFSGLVEAAATG